jgi:hypothetical protein
MTDDDRYRIVFAIGFICGGLLVFVGMVAL